MIYSNWLGLAILSSSLTTSPIDAKKSGLKRTKNINIDNNNNNINASSKLHNRKLGGYGSGGTNYAASSSNKIPANACLTEDQCRNEAHKRGIPDMYFYSNPDFHHCGCFKKEGKQHMMWGSCGTDADKTTVITEGIQVRVWCDSDWKGDDYDRDDGKWGGGSGWDEKPTLEPTLAPSDEKWNGDGGWNDKDKDGDWGGGGWDDKTADPTSEPTWEDDAWKDDGHKICTTANECRQQRNKEGITYFEVGNYNGPYGCFKHNGKAYWGKGGTDYQISKRLNGDYNRFYCDDHGDDWYDDGHDKPDGWDKDGWDGDGGWDKPTFSPTMLPTDSPTWNDDEWGNGWDGDGGWDKDTADPTAEPTWKGDGGWDKDGWGDGGGNKPNKKPTNKPNNKPTKKPTKRPTRRPDFEPTLAPSLSPTLAPTLAPSLSPTLAPTLAPTIEPTITAKPTLTPKPTPSPSKKPTPSPTQDCNDSPAPVINDDTYVLPLGTKRRGLNVLNNDVAAPGRTLKVESARALDEDQDYICEVSGNEMRVRFRNPEGEFEGEALCEYRACDECDKCGKARVLVIVGSSAPSESPSISPSESPSISSVPSESPTSSEEPSSQPSDEPSISTSPSSQPSEEPSSQPSDEPSISTSPSSQPSDQPSISTIPSSQPSDEPSISTSPSSQPSSIPSSQPSSQPSNECPSSLRLPTGPDVEVIVDPRTRKLDPGTGLGECQGNCNGDGDCAGDLVCFSQDGVANNASVPGCKGAEDLDFVISFCVKFIPENYLKRDGKPGTGGRCVGDCDEDSDCNVGLECFIRGGATDDVDVPGCCGTSTSTDYCIDPADVASTQDRL